MIRIGIDLGGTKIEGITLDRDGTILTRRRMATPATYDATLVAIRDLVADIAPDHPDVPVGIGTPGAPSRVSGLMRNCNSVFLNGRPLEKDLAQTLNRPVRLANDANCFALSEARDGAGAGASVVFGVILGTGVGGGIVTNGHLHIGHNAIGGEWGHMPLPWPRDDERPGPECYCGRKGCVESWLSGPAFAREQTHHADAFDLWLDRLARSLAVVIDILDPDVIVLGGGLSNMEETYSKLPARLAPYVFSDSVTTPIRRNIHGDSSGVCGAAWLWDEMP
ncbi:ROK family protein [Govanella unica]|uniref:ROK family protein n=1 Tax=Govanella unica TaxID=2975056 RepID=A0A9X3Z828_9PROT|nr:ROK family protein [Govania unica]MDA5194716.1 ROK family protein [Govania unica]